MTVFVYTSPHLNVFFMMKNLKKKVLRLRDVHNFLFINFSPSIVSKVFWEN